MTGQESTGFKSSRVAKVRLGGRDNDTKKPRGIKHSLLDLLETTQMTAEAVRLSIFETFHILV
jgi:hypothetical protein